LTDRV